MGCDPFSPICEAQLNVLCVPATRLPSEHLKQCISALQSCSLVGLRGVQRELAIDNASTNLKFIDGSLLLNIGSSFDETDLMRQGLTGPNRQPQIILGIVSGEDIISTSATEYQERLQAISKTFQAYSGRFKYAVVSAIVVFGGASPQLSGTCHWVDMEGQGPAVPDVLSSVVATMYKQLPNCMQDLRGQLIQSQRDSDTPRQSLASSSGNISGSSGADGRVTSNNAYNSSTGSTQLRPSGTQGDEFAARFSILQGMINMQMGQWLDALRQLSDGVSAIRNQADPLWYARGLEGLLACMLMLLWAHVDFTIPQICYPGTDKNGPVLSSRSMSAIIASNRASSTSLFSSTSSSPTHGLTELIPQLISTIFGLYERAAGMTDEVQLDLQLFESRIRWANLLILMKEHGGFLQDATLQHIIEDIHDRPQAKTPAVSTSSLVLQNSALCKLLVDTALELQLRLPIQQAVAIHIAIAQALSRLRLERKQGFYLKEFLQRLGPALAEAHRLGAAEMGMHPLASLSSSSSSRKGIEEEVPHGIRTLLDIVARVYGLPIQVKTEAAQAKSSTKRLSDAINFWTATQASGDLFIKLEILSLCTEISDAIPSPRDSLYFTSALLQAAKKVMTVSSNVPDVSPLLAHSDQSRLLQNMKRAATIAEKLDDSGSAHAEFWDKFLVRNIELLKDTHSDRLMPHTARDLSLATVGDDNSRKDPFIFNPFAKSKSSSSLSVITVGEFTSFGVVLQNPLDVEVEIEDITLSYEGCNFTPSHHSILLGPSCCQVFTLSGVPESEGELKITGCKATIRGCHEEEFMILPDNWKSPIDTKQRMRSHASAATTPSFVVPKAKEIPLKVTKALPSLSIISSSLLQPSLMLLEGESTKFELVVRNDSNIEIDFVLLTFEDTVKKRLGEALTNKDLSPADTYEIQYQIASRPAIRWTNATTGLRIPVQGLERFALEVFGQPGLTDVTIMIDYAYIGTPKEEVTDTFYTRQLSYNIATTVNGSVDIPRCLILPLQSDLYWNQESQAGGFKDGRLFSDLLANVKRDEHCILLLDIRNIWPQPLEIDLQARRSTDADSEDGGVWQNAYTVTELLQPGQMSRVLLLVPRIFISNPGAVIPSLDTKRQFVVSASKLTIEAETASRESFWYRERLLQCLRASWREQGGNKIGQLDMRKTIRLSSRMIDALRIDHVEISFSLRSADSDGAQDLAVDVIDREGASHFSLRRNSFATLVVTIRNRSSEDLGLLLRLQPSLRNQPHNIALDLSKRFAWSGVLQHALHPVLKPGESRVVKLSVVALAVGEYDVNATAEELRGRKGHAKPSENSNSVSERRLWHARHPCLIDAIEQDE